MTTDAFHQGKLAFEHNVPKSSCDYPEGSTLRSEWMEGWTQGMNAKPATHPQASAVPKTAAR